MTRTIVKTENVVSESSVTEPESEYGGEMQEPVSKPRFHTEWAQYDVVVHPALRPAVPISSRNNNIGTSTTNTTTDITPTGNTRKIKRERPENVESEKENIGLQLPKRRRIVSNSSMRGELSHLRKSMERILEEQEVMKREIQSIREAVELGLGKIYDILEGGSSQLEY
ncbi:hypothetical protein M422DRAFT_274747 [Sphaerobolus stellatus SS14]|uniref:Uncharacterized protein n=1 Tax=Sphaerobolus stellatus (strain SS14) TaxID=990650 RepID=A0A0C9T6C6_SPHS4|nr:hypothetical protein M422DRAFT_274747 [Sphaerobolus stellatus SS14]